jgi:hypothetical protein
VGEQLSGDRGDSYFMRVEPGCLATIEKEHAGPGYSLYGKGKNEHVGVKKSARTAFRELLSSCQIWRVNEVDSK